MARAAPYDRDATLDAAMSLFWERGYHATSLKDLEAALSMKPGSIYAAFKSKENLYLLAMERYTNRFRALFRERIAKASSPLQGMADYLHGFAALPEEDAARQACMLVKTIVATRSTEPAIAAQSEVYLTLMRDEFRQMFEAARARGEIPADSDCSTLARRFQAYVNVLRLEHHQGTDEREIEALARSLASEIEALRIGKK
ncbi:helix-turn-helix domain containing protein [Phaeobacter gallaeciensis]|jgi:AcrR family transcriptional regulator|uniref:TetR/AcrR family transcriptional regulator n=1 Tax=Phaeobacter gallaeciensis TaxID=60890 RepID=UPI00237FBAA9|nr:TetR/AcrR family transcriptional regulator [Phaeobacter gallaeciensis]MDE4306408.1 helix-turn-helix domain containing protein [Phaeobacter gallaeciensis]MDE4310872.1 helix-turn-helix domain containing protein [Phaeobacter gallaeciensis]MDE4315328.1 helix-turn-helix domain containing protein [Phaeobacter gallaeciensis]MDE4319800.1 helix-turn-helix domain containing protein [Phaeobacter gallaeciensis]MDE4324263.1 helix-turn-helix domain containing protein [Phaeobacter gallaeciensis]